MMIKNQLLFCKRNKKSSKIVEEYMKTGEYIEFNCFKLDRLHRRVKYFLLLKKKSKINWYNVAYGRTYHMIRSDKFTKDDFYEIDAIYFRDIYDFTIRDDSKCIEKLFDVDYDFTLNLVKNILETENKISKEHLLSAKIRISLDKLEDLDRLELEVLGLTNILEESYGEK